MVLFEYPNRGDEVIMCHFKDVYLLVEQKYLFCIGGPKMVLNGLKMVPNIPPPSPIPIPSEVKQICHEANKISYFFVFDDVNEYE